jgi:hypothetical protein
VRNGRAVGGHPFISTLYVVAASRAARIAGLERPRGLIGRPQRINASQFAATSALPVEARENFTRMELMVPGRRSTSWPSFQTTRSARNFGRARGSRPAGYRALLPKDGRRHHGREHAGPRLDFHDLVAEDCYMVPAAGGSAVETTAWLG